jgi:hypothetical protein
LQESRASSINISVNNLPNRFITGFCITFEVEKIVNHCITLAIK